MIRGAPVNEGSSSRSRRSFPWLRRRSPSRSRRSRHRTIELNSSFKSVSTSGANSSSTSTGESSSKHDRRIRRGGRRRESKRDKLAEQPSIRPGLSKQKSWKDTFKIPRATKAPEAAAPKDVESETSSTHVSSQRKQRTYVPAGARVERLPVSGPPRTIVANSKRLELVTGGTIVSQMSLNLDDMLEDDEVDLIEEEHSTIHDTSMDRTPTASRHSRRELESSASDSETEIPAFLEATSLYSDTDQALSATRKQDQKQGDLPKSSSGVSSAIPSLTISEGSSWLGSHLTTHLNDRTPPKDSSRHPFVRENSMKSRHSAGVSEATSLAESSAVYSLGYLSSAATSLENSSFSRRTGLLREEGNMSNGSLDLENLEASIDETRTIGDDTQTDSYVASPHTARRLAEIDREKEMLEIAIQRSLNDSASFQFQSAGGAGRYPSRMCALYTPPNQLQDRQSDSPPRSASKRSKSSHSKRSANSKPLGAFFQERIAEDERTAELIAESELMELAMERSIAEISANEQGPSNVSISSIYYVADQHSQRTRQTYPSLLSSPQEQANVNEDSDNWDSWQERARSRSALPSSQSNNPQEVSGESRTDSRRRPNIRSRSVEIPDYEEESESSCENEE